MIYFIIIRVWYFARLEQQKTATPLFRMINENEIIGAVPVSGRYVRVFFLRG